jgi:hypothetical protein
LAVRDDVFVEAQLAAGAQHASELGQCVVLVGNRAENEAGDGGVDALVLERQLFGDPGQDADRDRRGGCRLYGGGAQGGLGLDGDDLGHRGRVVGEVEAVSGAQLEHGAAQPVEQPAPVLGRAAPLGGLGGAEVGAREAWSRKVAGGCHRVMPPVGSGVAPARAAMPSTSRASALENRSRGTARSPWSM